MALKFGDSTGGSTGQKVDSYKFVDGEQKVRLFGDLLARYLFWFDNPKGQPNQLPVEALQFDRETESWDNSRKDPVKEQFPDLKPKWSYSCLCLTEGGEVKVFNFKRTLFNQIKDAMESLGDPTDLDNGWWVVFKKNKTGPSPLNVEYSLQELKSSKEQGPVSDEMKKKAEEHAPISEVYPRPTEDQVRQNLQNILSSGNDEEVDEDATGEFEVE